MIEDQPSARSDVSPMHRVTYKILAGISLLFLVGVAIALGTFLGTGIGNDEWPLLVSAAGLATYMVIALIDARHAFLLWIATAPFARFVYLNVEFGRGIPDLKLNRFMIGVLLVLLLAQLATRRRKLARFNIADALLVGYCAAAALSVPHALMGTRSAAQSFFDIIFIPVGVYFLARNLITDYKHLRAMMLTLVVIGVYLALLATREQLTGNVWFYFEDRSVYYTRSIRRVVGLLGNPGYIAMCVGMAVPWCWYLFQTAHRHRLLYLLALASMLVGIFFCMNRSGWVALVVCLVVMAVFVKRFRGVFLLFLLLSVAAVVTYWAWITASPAVQERLQAQAPIEYRRETWDIALRMIKDNPTFGVGYDNFRHYYTRYAIWDIYLRATPTPHNTFLWVTLMGGVVAFVPFIAFLGAVMLYALGSYARWRSRREELPEADLAGTFLASMSAFLMPALVMDVLEGYYTAMLTFFIIGAYLGAMSGERQRLIRLRSASGGDSEPLEQV